MDKLSVMNAFRRIVERGSFARAAEDLGVSPALLSREIKLLEQLREQIQLQKRGLMQKLLTGEWRVEVSDDEEAAA